ncbi:MAG: Flp family type IVb pilin [Planctomycetes bacterium]|nr:Flp family type IVb pilin [Planctomycetota bacterium]
MKQLMNRKLSNETGASMTEYIIIVALVAIFLIGAVGLFGDKVKSLFSTSTTKLNAVQSKMNSR